LILITNLAKVPTKLVNLPALRADLGALILDQDYVLLPREYMDFTKLGEVVYANREYVRRFSLDANTVLWDAQWPAFVAMMLSGNGILNLAPGKGKTRTAIEYLLTWGVKTAIIVDKIGLLDQWYNALIEHVAEVEEHIGIVHQNKAELDKNIVLISAKTLIPRLESGKITSEDLADFDLVIFDECHHFAAPTFLQLCPLFGGLRLGLTATPNREDGLDRLFKMHLGEVFYSDLVQDLIPHIEFIPMGTMIYEQDQEAISDCSGELHYKKLCIWLGQNSARNLRIIQDVTDAAQKGHHVLVLTHSKEHTETLTALFSEHTVSLDISTVCINGSSHKLGRTDKIRNHRVIFATFDVAAEALDAPSLSYLYFATPPGAREYGNTLQQALGRIQRKHSSKLHPEVRILEDINIEMCRSLLRQVKRRLREWNYPYKELKKDKKIGSRNYKKPIR
jgi:superfamily II DNA or RNA helicase